MAKSTGKSSSSRSGGAESKATPRAPSRPNANSSAKSNGNVKPKGGTPAKGAAKGSSKSTPSKSAPSKSKPRSKPSSSSPRKQSSSGPSKRRRIPTVRPNGATVLVALVVILGIAVLAPTAQRYIAQRQYVAQLQAELVETQQSVDEIATERDRWSDPAYIQSQARGRLLFVMPGDTSYLVLDPPVTNKQQQSNISTELHETQASWLDSFVESMVTAGTAPAPAPTPGD
ncbi:MULTISPECIES: FtsB family cell division protein [unclassified Pseudoclavibacter]|uniref:FtsB family cell division protein n=1 Tax=unclassified Pseudoclavibacter TaxID=2615177 RepID=UPI00135A7C87|nr:MULTISPECIES: septum formation initiator family protein [unclassified Pseudoclavibacter]MBF4459851.1 septum formation initiator family protein [Pseudoclavibacter sp. VKM Ac-2867]